MCTYVTHSTEVLGSAYARGDWISVHQAVVSFDHPQDIAVDHALCIDLRTGDPAVRVAVELDADSARRLAESIVAALESDEARALL